PRQLLSSGAMRFKKLRNSWRVPGGISALGGRNTFMPARKNRRAGQMSQPERKIMKTRNTSSMFIAILLAFLALGATKAQANIDIYRPVGITFGQTARVTAANTGTTAIIINNGKFLDSDGNVLAEFRGTVEPGEMMSFDLNADDIVRESNRIQIRV